MGKALRIAQKEIAGFFSSPVAFLFLGAFLAINLFIFFWVSAFFSRNIADVRPLFQWMPLLLIFLVGALTMRMWSEERRAGTVEFLLTLPISSFQLVLGKFLACLSLVVIALVLTLPIPFSVSALGELDWGPVLGAYVASIFLAGAYAAIGLFVSARSDNQIVCLITTSIICLAFYLIGSPLLTPFVGNQLGEALQLFGSGSRFESITRGVLDIRDVYYYLSLIGTFLALNVYSLEQLRWSQSGASSAPRVWRNITILLCLNFLLGNFWMVKVNAARLDLTATQMYSISDASRNYLNQLQEPLLIRGYFSEKTHPLLAPLVPQVRDLISEYAVVSNGKVRAEFIDPRQHPELEEEANQKYGIKSVPFQISGKYDVSLINSYFDVLIEYGDKYEVINFQDLIEVKFRGESDIEVKLRNPEYDITSSIKKVLYGFQTTDNLFQTITDPIIFEGFISSDGQLPPTLLELRGALSSVLEDYSKIAGNKLQVVFKDPEEAGGGLKVEIAEKYGFRPMTAGLFSKDTFYFYMLFRQKDKHVVIPFPEDMNKEGIRRSIEGALKRFSPGFLKTVGLVEPPKHTPSLTNPVAPPGTKGFRLLTEHLSQGYTVKSIQINKGIIPDDIDLLLVAAPKDLTEAGVFAIDQFMMKGGTVVLLSSPFSTSRSRTTLQQEENVSGLSDWLESFGVSIAEELVFDPQNESYPIPVQRNIGGFTVQEMRKVPYLLFPDIRSDRMNQDSLITSGVPQVTLSWSSPISIDAKKIPSLEVTELLRTSPMSWSAKPSTISPDFESYPQLGFPPENPRAALVGAVLEGKFSSFFVGKESPLLALNEQQNGKTPPAAEGEEPKEEKETFSSIIEKSPATARLILFSSNEFLTDQTLQISASSGTSRFLNSVQLLQNSLDWALEDRGLLSIRNRGHFSRTLYPLERRGQKAWEYGNYLLALLGLLFVYVLYGLVARKRARRHNTMLTA